MMYWPNTCAVCYEAGRVNTFYFPFLGTFGRRKLLKLVDWRSRNICKYAFIMKARSIVEEMAIHFYFRLFPASCAACDNFHSRLVEIIHLDWPNFSITALSVDFNEVIIQVFICPCSNFQNVINDFDARNPRWNIWHFIPSLRMPWEFKGHSVFF